MNVPAFHDAVLVLIDAVLGDLSVRSAMYLGRRSQDADVESFVIQAGEDGRRRLSLPDLTSNESVEAVVADAQAFVEEVLGTPTPRCALHEHALVARTHEGGLRWECPDGLWSCGVGDYEEVTWPQLDVQSLASILSRRLGRRGIDGVVTVGVSRTGAGLVAEIGVETVTVDLTQALRDAAAPLLVSVHREAKRMVRLGASPP